MSWSLSSVGKSLTNPEQIDAGQDRKNITLDPVENPARSGRSVRTSVYRMIGISIVVACFDSRCPNFVKLIARQTGCDLRLGKTNDDSSGIMELTLGC
jgi:hypothetical protein